MNGLLESRVLGNLHARFGGGETKKYPQGQLVGSLPYKEQEKRHDVGLLKYLNSWGKLQEYPGRMIDWDAEQVARAYAEAVRKLQAIHPASEVYEEALSN